VLIGGFVQVKECRGGSWRRTDIKLVDDDGQSVVCKFWGDAPKEVAGLRTGTTLNVTRLLTVKFNGRLELKASSDTAVEVSYINVHILVYGCIEALLCRHRGHSKY